MHRFNNIFAADFREFLANMPNVAVNGAVADVDIAVVSVIHDVFAAENTRWLAAKHL